MKMISRVTMRKSGLASYLESGKRADSKYNRLDKDNVISLYGSLDTLKEAEIYTNKYKKWNYNYEHITISFSKEDMRRLDMLNYNDRMEALRDITTTMIKHRTSGYDLDNEIIAYAECHQPKIKYEFGKERLEHIHIGISYLNALNNTKIRTTFYNNSYISDTIDKYIALKHNLTFANTNKRIKDLTKTNYGKYREQLKEDLKEINSREELIQYFKDNNINYREVRTKNNNYFKIINKGMKNINLRGRGFEHISNIVKGNHIEELKSKSLKELEKILSEYYKQRIDMIDKRRSKETKEAIKDIYRDDDNERDNETSISNLKTYQQKIFYKHYKHLIDDDLKGYYIDTKENDNTKFINKQKNINIEDKGDKIVTYDNDIENMQERVKLLLDIAEAKKWDIFDLKIIGNEEFKEEVERQIAERLRLREQSKQTLSLTEAELIKEQIQKRPKTPTQQIKKEAVEKEKNKKIDKDISLSLLKQNLKAINVLNYAVDKYKLNKDYYELTDDNKINNKNNRQKPKNVIDFLQRELHLTTKESIEICKELYSQQINLQTEETKETDEQRREEMALKISICKDNNINAVNKWEQVEVKSYGELATLMKQYPYSATQFESGYRNSDNAKSFNNVLIYDIDNDKGTPQLTIKEAKEILEKHNISAMILPSKSHLKDKHGHIAERYRIVIPTNRAIDIQDKETFREFQRLTAKALKIDKYVDTKALNDKARFYYKSPISAEPTIIKSNRIMNIDNLESKAIENVTRAKEEKERELKELEKIRANIKQYKQVNNDIGNYLTYANINKIMQLNIEQLIRYFERDIKEYKEGDYKMIKTANAKYSIIDNIAHDFKSDYTYNNITYLQKQFDTTNLNIIARELEKITGDTFIEVNISRVKEIIEEARTKAYNDKTFEKYIKDSFGVKYCKLDKDSVIIADKEIKLNDIDMQKIDIVNDLKANRKKQAKKNQIRR